MILVAVSGGYDPIHIGHIRQLQHAARLGHILMVFLNSDEWLDQKKGYHNMTWSDRREILQAIQGVSVVVPVDDRDGTVASAIRLYRPHLFAKGGDRTTPVLAEVKACQSVGCQMVFGVGSKVEASSHFRRVHGEV